MDKQKRDSVLSKIGATLESLFPDLFGSVRFNLKNGRAINTNIEEVVKRNSEGEFFLTIWRSDDGEFGFRISGLLGNQETEKLLSCINLVVGKVKKQHIKGV